MDENKPISVMLDEFKRDVSNVITNSGLHPSIIEPILYNIYTEISELSKRQLEIEKADYLKKNNPSKIGKETETSEE